MKIKNIFLLLVYLSFANIINAQTLRGSVLDAESKAPLAHATIKITGRSNTQTDKDGRFSVPCSPGTELIVSYVGYESQKQTIPGCDEVIIVALTRSGNNLNNIEITATSNTNKSLLSQPSSITKLTAVELKRGTGLFLDDAINTNLPGVSMERRAVSSGQQFNIRGYGNGSRGTRGISSNFDGQGYKVYLNGIPVTDAEGITVLDDIDYALIGNVEVSKGPSGTLYGLAIAGVVNLQTMKPETGKSSISQDVLIGNYGLRRYTTRFATAGQHSSLLLTYGHQQSDGFMSHSYSNKNFVNAIGSFQPNEKQNINYYAGFSNSYDERSGELTVAQYDSMNYVGNPEYIKRNAHSQVISFRAGIGHTYNFSKGIANTTSVFATGAPNNASSAGGWTDKDPFNYGLRSAFSTNFSFSRNVGLSGITGVEMQQQRAQTVGYTMLDPQGTSHVWKFGDPWFVIGAATSNIFTISSTASTFTEWTLGLPQNFSVTAGLGLSTMKIRLYDRFYEAARPGKPTYFNKTYNGMFSPHLAINKIFNNEFSIYAAYNKAYKAPVSSYFYIPYALTGNPLAQIPNTGIVNTALEAEKGAQFEIGAKGNLNGNKLFYQVALYDIRYNNKFTTVAVPLNATTTAYTYVVNGGKQDHKGFEALVKYKAYDAATGFFRIISPFANTSYVDYRYKDYPFQASATSTVNYKGHAVVGMPKLTVNAGVDINMAAGIYANATYLYKAKMPFTSDGIYYARSYNLLNAKIGLRRSLSSHFDVDAFFGCDNITNTQYPLMVFVNQIPDAYLPAPLKAAYYGSIILKYNF